MTVQQVELDLHQFCVVGATINNIRRVRQHASAKGKSSTIAHTTQVRWFAVVMQSHGELDLFVRDVTNRGDYII